LSARIILFSGRTGQILQEVGVPDHQESYYSPQVYTLPDGTDMVLFGTGGETHPGSLWTITLDNLYKGNIQKVKYDICNLIITRVCLYIYTVPVYYKCYLNN